MPRILLFYAAVFNARFQYVVSMRRGEAGKCRIKKREQVSPEGSGRLDNARKMDYSGTVKLSQTIRMQVHAWLSVFAGIALGACATPASQEHLVTVPSQVSNAYSEMGMRLHLATETDIESSCAGEECDANRAFYWRVMQLGENLAKTAFEITPGLNERIARFEFLVVEKSEPGSASSAAGTIVIFRGVQQLSLNEEALSFLIAREMGHVIGRHHDRNSTTSIAVSVLAQVLVPITNIFRGAAALLETTPVTTSMTTASSVVGSRAMIENYKSSQQYEADTIAINLLARQGWDRERIANALAASAQPKEDNDWSKEFQISSMRVSQVGARWQ